MCNIEFKEEFCRTRKGTDTNLFRSVLSRIEILEEKYEKDAAYFNRSEILELYHMIKYVNPQSYRTLNRIMVQYCDEFHEQRLEYFNDYKGITSTDFEQCADISKIQDKIITKESINALVSSLPDNTDKAIIMLLWHGVQGDNLSHITSLTEENLYSASCTVSIEGYEYILDRATVRYLSMAFRETSLHSYGNGRSYMVYGEGCLYKMTGKAMNEKQDDLSMMRWIKRRLAKIKTHYGFRYFDVITIRDSGLFHKILIGSGGVPDKKRFLSFLSTESGTNLLKVYLTGGKEVPEDCRHNCVKKYSTQFKKKSTE